jgi:hypothetical protein
LRGLNHATFGLALLVVATGAIISMPIAGTLSARIGTGRICQFSALTYCLALPPLALLPDPTIWGLALFVFGTGHGALDVAMNAQAVAIGLAAAGYGVFSIAMAAGRFSGDWLSAHFRPVNLVRGGGLLAAEAQPITMATVN